jgi:hypothetical protein
MPVTTMTTPPPTNESSVSVSSDGQRTAALFRRWRSVPFRTKPAFVLWGMCISNRTQAHATIKRFAKCKAR